MFEQFVDNFFWYFASVVFVTGVIWRLIAIVRIGIKPDLSLARGSGFGGALRTLGKRFWPQQQAQTAGKFQIIAGYMFHLGLFVLLLFAAPHIQFLEERILGFSWTAAPHWLFILAAEFAFAGLLLLWLRRLFDPVLRQLSDADDHVGSVLTFIVMFTGCMALFESFSSLRVLHLFTVELLMIYFPFSRLMHAFTFVFSRSYTGANYGRRNIRI